MELDFFDATQFIPHSLWSVSGRSRTKSNIFRHACIFLHAVCLLDKKNEESRKEEFLIFIIPLEELRCVLQFIRIYSPERQPSPSNPDSIRNHSHSRDRL